MNTESETPERPFAQLLSVSKVYFTKKIETHALSDVSLSIQRGEYLLIHGPSGSGKSTLLSILGLIERPTSGEYRFQGTHTGTLGLTTCARLRNQEFGFIFQSFNLISDMTILGNVELPLRYRKGSGKTTRPERIERAMSLLEEIGIAHRCDHYPAQLSGGQQQRAALARALIGEPSLLLADEPTGNLDSDSEDIVMDLLSDYNAKGMTLCVVSHNPRYAQVADRMLALSEGRLDQ